MAYQVTFVNTKNNASDPDFPDWVKTLTDDYLYSLYPELNGATPTEVINAVPDAMDPADGFISSQNTRSEDGSVTTLVELWDDQASYEAFKLIVNPSLDDPLCNVGTISCSTTSTTVTGTGTNFSHLKYGDIIIGSETIGSVASVASDSSLTLQANSSLDVSDITKWIVAHKQNAIDYLFSQYPYTVTTEVTYANV